MTPLHIFYAIFVSFLWGLNFIAAKFSLVHFPVLFMLSLRLFIAAALIMPFVARPKIPWKSLLLLSFTMAVINTGFGYGALRLGLNASVAVIVDQLRVPFAVVVSVLFLKEKTRWRTNLGIALSFVGTLFIVRSPDNIGNGLAILSSIAGALGWAWYNLQIKQLGKTNILSLLGTVSLLGAMQLLLCSYLLEDHQLHLLMTASWKEIAGILYISIFGMVMGQGLWFYLLHRYDVSEVAPYSLLVTFFGVISSMLVLGEKLHWQVFIGGVIVIGGVGLIIWRRPQIAKMGDNV